MSALHFGAVFCSFISLLCLLTALGSDYWLADSVAHLGLWKICNQEKCHSLGVEWVSAALHAIRTFMFLGMIAGAVSLGGLCVMNSQPRLAYMASFTAGLCVMIAMSIFSGRVASASKFGWSFGLGWASFPLYLLNGCLTYILYKNTATTG
ncbi:protein NKG7-like [Pseudonaja textilis]|uniref:protein NKG7-like n=1 Tax=Pseudonaja textilis TaxID=8673 RepID=UPI000EAA6650|nr:protein NKG7-like [Pseudonaja textilis]XP_026574577.1 protein NKG7-like [Pseudonaja textilis]